MWYHMGREDERRSSYRHSVPVYDSYNYSSPSDSNSSHVSTSYASTKRRWFVVLLWFDCLDQTKEWNQNWIAIAIITHNPIQRMYWFNETILVVAFRSFVSFTIPHSSPHSKTICWTLRSSYPFIFWTSQHFITSFFFPHIQRTWTSTSHRSQHAPSWHIFWQPWRHPFKGVPQIFPQENQPFFFSEHTSQHRNWRDDFPQ